MCYLYHVTFTVMWRERRPQKYNMSEKQFTDEKNLMQIYKNINKQLQEDRQHSKLTRSRNRKKTRKVNYSIKEIKEKNKKTKVQQWSETQMQTRKNNNHDWYDTQHEILRENRKEKFLNVPKLC